MASFPTGIITDQSQRIGGARSEFRFERVESVGRRTTDIAVTSAAGSASATVDATQPPVGERSLEGRQRHRSGGQRVFLESMLLSKILVTRVNWIRQGAVAGAIRDCCATCISACWPDAVILIRCALTNADRSQPTAGREH